MQWAGGWLPCRCGEGTGCRVGASSVLGVKHREKAKGAGAGRSVGGRTGRRKQREHGRCGIPNLESRRGRVTLAQPHGAGAPLCPHLWMGGCTFPAKTSGSWASSTQAWANKTFQPSFPLLQTHKTRHHQCPRDLLRKPTEGLQDQSCCSSRPSASALSFVYAHALELCCPTSPTNRHRLHVSQPAPLPKTTLGCLSVNLSAISAALRNPMGLPTTFVGSLDVACLYTSLPP